jgi:hypothetical protein
VRTTNRGQLCLHPGRLDIFFALQIVWLLSPGPRQIQDREGLRSVLSAHPKPLHGNQTGRHGSRGYSGRQEAGGGKHPRCKNCEEFGVRIASGWRLKVPGWAFGCMPGLGLHFPSTMSTRNSLANSTTSRFAEIAYHDHASHDFPHARSYFTSARFRNRILVRIDAESCAAWRDEGSLEGSTPSTLDHLSSTVTVYKPSP